MSSSGRKAIKLLSDAQLKQLKGAFRTFDKDLDGKITFEELKEVLNTLSSEDSKVDDEEVKDMLTMMDSDRSGTISFEEFVSMQVRGGAESTPEAVEETNEDLENAFLVLDKDNSGFVEVKELKAMMKTQGILDADLDKTVRSMILEADEDGDGKINLNEFIRAWKA